MALSVYLTPQNLFPGKTVPTIEECLSTVESTLILRFAFHFLNMPEVSHDTDSLKRFLFGDPSNGKSFFSIQSKEFVYVLDKRIDSLFEMIEGRRVTLFNIEGLLRIIEIIIVQKSQQTHSSGNVEMALFFSLLHINAELDKENLLAKSSIENQDEIDLSKEDKLLWPFFLNEFAKSDITQQSIRNLVITEYFKGYYLYKFASRDLRIQQLFDCLVGELKVNSFDQYCKAILWGIMGFLKPQNQGRNEIIVDSDAGEGVAQLFNYFDLKTTLPISSLSDDHIDLRTFPLYSSNDKSFDVIFKLFFCEKLYKGLVFGHFRKIVSEKKIFNDFGVLRSVLGTEFSERYLFTEVMNQIIPDSEYKLSEGEIKNLGGDGKCDYYFRGNRAVFLFEMKDVSILSGKKRSCDYKVVRDELKGKLWVKGIKQLINNLVDLHSANTGKWNLDPSVPQNLPIFSVLVVGTRELEVIGINKILNGWFDEDLKSRNLSPTFMLRVKPLIIISIDTLILIKEFLRNCEDRLVFLFTEYVFDLINPEVPTGPINFERKTLRSWLPFSRWLEEKVDFISKKFDAQLYQVPKDYGGMLQSLIPFEDIDED